MSEPTPTESAAPFRADRPSRIGNFRSSAAQFLGALILMLFMAPFLDELEYGPAIDTLFITLVLILGVLAVGRSHRTLVLGVALMFPAVATRWAAHFCPHLLPLVVHNVAALVFIIFVEYQLLQFVFRAPRVNSEVLCAGISGYLLLGILWMSAYLVVSRLHPVDLVHPALSCVHGGHHSPYAVAIRGLLFQLHHPEHRGLRRHHAAFQWARTLAMMEAMTGTLYMAVLISRLVALYSSQSSACVRMPRNSA